MADDATTQLRQGTETDPAIIAFLTTLTAAVGIVSNYLDVIGLLASLLPSATKASDAAALGEISQKLNDLLLLASANALDVKMAELNRYAISADSDLVTIANSVTGTIDPTSAISFQKDAISFLTAASEPEYWTRPFLQQLTFLPQGIIGTGPGPWSASWGWYGNLPYPPTQAGIYPMVLDPGLAVPYFLKAIEAFLAINALLNPNGFRQFIDGYNKAPDDFLPSVANNLQQLYATFVNGLVKSDVPTTNDMISYLTVWRQVPNVGPPTEPSCAIPETGGLPVGETFDPTMTIDKSGCSWNGIYGVVDKYGIYISKGTASFPGVQIPMREASGMVEIFPVNGIPELPPDHPFLPGHAPYRWVRDRITLGLMARWKAIYMLRSYHLAWSVLQKLRLILGEQADDKLTLADGTIASENWSVRELISVLQLRPLLQYIDPTSGDYIPEGWYRVFHLVQRFDLIAKGTWATPVDDDFFDNDEWMNHTVVIQRPVSFRERLAAAAV